MTAIIIETTRKKKLALPGHMTRKTARPAAATAVSRAAISAAPTACANALCPDPLSGHVTFDAEVGDKYCALCGEYQSEIDEESRADG